MNNINYIKGDATFPIGEGNKILVHICNDVGGWGKGFVLALSKRWIEPELEYRNWFKNKIYSDDNFKDCEFKLGNIQLVKVSENISVINMIAQHKCYHEKDKEGKISPPIRYEALKECLEKVAKIAIENNATVHMPRIGAGLAGGDWNLIGNIINETLVDKGIKTNVYIF